MKHDWIKHEDGEPSETAWFSGYHNGYKCQVCGLEVCMWCNDFEKVKDEECDGDGVNKDVVMADDSKLNPEVVLFFEKTGLGVDFSKDLDTRPVEKRGQ